MKTQTHAIAALVGSALGLELDFRAAAEAIGAYFQRLADARETIYRSRAEHYAKFSLGHWEIRDPVESWFNWWYKKYD